ncbi:hypothetical protein C4F40_21230 [Sphingobacterium sp. Ka21]|uniref:DUF4625 domain-containing protein n=2 Tax=Sphingobacterium pedocola TaxID=2082722 RepID=A0ABR9TEF1_9SPHI|nr:hypothetical protein [Sphingobacterium pedocola]
MAMAIGGLALGFASCSKDGGDDVIIPEAPKITVEATGLAVTDGIISVAIYQDSTIALKYSVEAAGKIKKLDQTLDGVLETVADANAKTSFSKDIALDIPLEDKSYVLKVEVTDENGKSTASTVTIRVRAIIPPSVPLTTVTTVEMGGISGSKNSRWDLDIPEGYGGLSMRCTPNSAGNIGVNCGKAPFMDSFYTNNSLNNTDTEQDRFANTGARFLVTNFTKAEFDAMRNDLPLQKLVINQTKVEELEVGQVIAFKTNEGKIGVLYFESLASGVDDATFLLKIQQ